jgi:uncharacterized membrane protein
MTTVSTTPADVPVSKRVPLLPAHPARLASVDILRGLVMVIMALDHTRDFLTYLRFPPELLSNTYGALFFTRFITHYCAPVFSFLAVQAHSWLRRVENQYNRFPGSSSLAACGLFSWNLP